MEQLSSPNSAKIVKLFLKAQERNLLCPSHTMPFQCGTQSPSASLIIEAEQEGKYHQRYSSEESLAMAFLRVTRGYNRRLGCQFTPRLPRVLFEKSLRDLPETVSGLVLHSHAIISHKLSLESNKPGPRQLGRRRILMASSFSTNSLPPVPRPNMTIIVPSSSRGRMFRSGRVICSLPKVTLSTKVKIGRIVRVQDSTVLWKLVNSQLWQPQEMGSSIKIFTSTVGDWYQVVAVIAQTCSFAERTINCTNPAV
jgi:hypothetical protein